MFDPRLTKMAKVLVHYSMKIQKNELLLIRGSDLAAPLMRAVFKEALIAGAHPKIEVTLDGIGEIFYKNATEEQLRFIPPYELHDYETFDAILDILGGYNKFALSSIAPEKISKCSKSHAKIKEIFNKRLNDGNIKWCATQYPTQSGAQAAHMSLLEYESFIFHACFIDKEYPVKEWLKLHEMQATAIAFLKNKNELKFVSEDTNIKCKISNRIWMNCDGQINFPDGEIFTGPIENTVEGHIRFSFPGVFSGQEIEDISLTFEKGQVVKATAKKGQALLDALLNTDPGAKYVGEVAIGTNYGIKQFTKNMLFDEKIGGTIHMALGASIPMSGGLNNSSIHWDMLCDMRNGGEIYADDQLFYKNGKFILNL